MSEPPRSYAQRWESYWSEVTKKGTRVMWDVAKEDGVALDWPNIQPFVDPSLPMVHLGCGHGRQTAFFGDHFERVLGVDISPTAIARAERENPHERVEYRVLDAMDHEAIAALHDELGDANVYVRGVLHQLAPDDQLPFLEPTLQLIGDRGTLCVLELRRGAEQIFFPLVKMGLLSFLRPVLDNGIKPLGITPKRFRELVPDTHEVVSSRPTVLMRLPLPLPLPFKVPAWHMAVRKLAPTVQ
ncbi:class I SAM-dependent methyltransferase [Paraliomyxa miuraensis]|uniref:class I SAM-dependent methyltransferase n=1 Tax=Paraliomyxa miuraensis TaxID=376150 RepID=UPI002250190D|nr:class I SAM-dependent methyltransferase [Paraliomyxa miuraensis]MCX4247140.1 class I SAM-dependent methyltransferase [Paraliomyxa miuraensis]